MTQFATLVQHRTLPGKREDVERVWQKHIKPHVAGNPNFRAYFYCFGDDPDSIGAFQSYSDRNAAAAFVKTPEYAAYYEEVKPYLLGDPTITVLDVRWSK